MTTPLSSLGQRTQAPPISWLMDLALARPDLISLAAGFTDNETLPVAEARALLDQILGSRRTGQPALQYGSNAGLPELRQATIDRLRTQDANALATQDPAVTAPSPADAGPAVPAPGSQPPAGSAPLLPDPGLYSADQLLLTHGSQQFLYLVTECLCDPGDLVLIEDPTYFVYLGIMQSHGLQCRGLRLEADGLELAHLERVLTDLKRSGSLKRLKLLYLVSYHQNPTGTTTSFAKKTAALELLRRFENLAGHPIYLLEDAAYRELRFAGPDVASALAIPGAGERVIYTGTYSKPFATGVRVGFGWLPEAVREAVTRVKSNHDFGTASLLQHLLAQALGAGVYDQHLERLRRRYARKAAGMIAALRQHLPKGVRWQDPSGGMYVWAALPRSIKSGLRSALFQRALAHQVLYVPGQLCYGPDPTRMIPNHEMRLSFGNATEKEIDSGLQRLGAALGAPR